MLHGLEISIAQMAGKKKGVHVTEPVDVVYATQSGTGQRRKIGFVARHDGATVCFIRHFRAELKEDVRKEVERLRHATPEGWTIAARASQMPDPQLVQAYLKGDLTKSKKTTIVRPDGELFGDDNEEDGDFLDE